MRRSFSPSPPPPPHVLANEMTQLTRFTATRGAQSTNSFIANIQQLHLYQKVTATKIKSRKVIMKIIINKERTFQ